MVCRERSALKRACPDDVTGSMTGIVGGNNTLTAGRGVVAAEVTAVLWEEELFAFCCCGC